MTIIVECIDKILKNKLGIIWQFKGFYAQSYSIEYAQL